MNIMPLSKAIYDKAKELGFTQILLEFSGGSDEGHLNLLLEPNFEWGNKNHQSFANEVEEWVWDVYEYSGAGDGNDYGDNVTYDLEKGTVTTNEWCMERKDGAEESLTLEVRDSKDEDDEDDEDEDDEDDEDMIQ